MVHVSCMYTSGPKLGILCAITGLAIQVRPSRQFLSDGAREFDCSTEGATNGFLMYVCRALIIMTRVNSEAE